jgi:hypothetical protein
MLDADHFKLAVPKPPTPLVQEYAATVAPDLERLNKITDVAMKYLH